jgi:hypothetical protein
VKWKDATRENMEIVCLDEKGVKNRTYSQGEGRYELRTRRKVGRAKPQGASHCQGSH